MKKSLLLVPLAIATAGGTVGCHNAANSAKTSASKTSGHKTNSHEKPPALTSEQLQQAHPNEAGLVPILVYHDILNGTPRQVKLGLTRSPDQFRQDLTRLHTLGYLPVSLSEYLNNKMDLPYGKSPVILTFDDALPSQFTYQAGATIDPNCAVGILQTFHQQNPDWALKGTFFVRPINPGFGPNTETAKKLQALISMGFEIGNGTLHRINLKRLSDERVQQEIGASAAEIHKMVPNTVVDTLALPMSFSPQNKRLETDGQASGYRYHNRAVLLAGGEPARAPIAKKFNPLRIPRIQAVEGISGITFFLDRLKGSSRYISDGDVNITTIPRVLLPRILPARLNGAKLRTYGESSE